MSIRTTASFGSKVWATADAPRTRKPASPQMKGELSYSGDAVVLGGVGAEQDVARAIP